LAQGLKASIALQKQRKKFKGTGCRVAE
jgi:hypothetical protein